MLLSQQQTLLRASRTDANKRLPVIALHPSLQHRRKGAQVKLSQRSPVRLLPCRAGDSGLYSSSGGAGSPDLPVNTASGGFGRLERYVAERAQQTNSDSTRTDWMQVAGCWVLMPPRRQVPNALVFFTGGAFAGAAPQLTYRLLIECLASRGVAVVAVPFSTGFNHTRIADEVNYKFQQCLAELALRPDTAMLPALPLYGMGHSLGALVQLLISTTYATPRAGNALLSFNNKALDDVPLLTPFLGPAGAIVGPLLSQLATSPARSAVLNALENLRRSSPKLVQDVLPILDQLEPIFTDVANGTQQFSPHPDETSQNLRANYGVQRNLIIQFANDTIDESPRLKEALQANPVAAPQLVFRVLPGDHTRPLLQAVGDLPSSFKTAADQATLRVDGLLGQASLFAKDYGFPDAAKNFQDFATNVKSAGQVINGSVAASNAAAGTEMQLLADEVADWMGAMALPAQPEVLLPPGRF